MCRTLGIPTYNMTRPYRKNIVYEKGARNEKAVAGQVEVEQLQKANKRANRTHIKAAAQMAAGRM